MVWKVLLELRFIDFDSGFIRTSTHWAKPVFEGHHKLATVSAVNPQLRATKITILGVPNPVLLILTNPQAFELRDLLAD